MSKIKHWETENYAGKFLVSNHNISFEWHFKHTFGQVNGTLPIEFFMEISKEVQEYLNNLEKEADAKD